jgi:hypothetical protein
MSLEVIGAIIKIDLIPGMVMDGSLSLKNNVFIIQVIMEDLKFWLQDTLRIMLWYLYLQQEQIGIVMV